MQERPTFWVMDIGLLKTFPELDSLKTQGDIPLLTVISQVYPQQNPSVIRSFSHHDVLLGKSPSIAMVDACRLISKCALECRCRKGERLGKGEGWGKYGEESGTFRNMMTVSSDTTTIVLLLVNNDNGTYQEKSNALDLRLQSVFLQATQFECN